MTWSGTCHGADRARSSRQQNAPGGPRTLESLLSAEAGGASTRKRHPDRKPRQGPTRAPFDRRPELGVASVVIEPEVWSRLTDPADLARRGWWRRRRRWPRKRIAAEEPHEALERARRAETSAQRARREVEEQARREDAERRRVASRRSGSSRSGRRSRRNARGAPCSTTSTSPCSARQLIPHCGSDR